MVKFIYQYIKKYGFIFLSALLFLIIEATCDLLQPILMSKIIDIGVRNDDTTYIFRQSMSMLSIAFVGAICACVRSIMASNVSQRIGTAIRFDLFKKILEISFNSRNEYDEASLITRLTQDVTQIQNFTNGLMRIFIRAPLLCIGSIVMTIYISPPLSVVMLIVVPVIIFFMMIRLKKVYPFFVRIQKAVDRMNTVIREYLSGIRVVKAFNRSDYEMIRFEDANTDLGETMMQTFKQMAIFSPFIQFIVNLGIVAIIWISGFLVQHNSIQVGEVIAFISYMTQLLFALSTMSHAFLSFVRARTSAERIEVIFHQNDDKTDYGLTDIGEETFEKAIKEGSIIFENVSFSYGNTSMEPVLEDISFRCQKGQTIGIIGSTGSGKSTLINLLTGFYYPSQGCIKIGGTDIKTISAKSLREHIAIVPQKVMLFTGTIKENIKWGKQTASLDEIEEVTRIVEAYAFIQRFPEGYDTLLGKGGVNLSGGQKQRISIARALIKKPQILILDDCTSAIDLITEAKIRKQLKAYMNDLTAFIIAQRITSVKGADKIIVLDHGKIAGMGKHDELLETCEVYRDIYRSQLGEEGLEREQ